MRVVETKVFTFDELSKEAQENAVENIRNSEHYGWDFGEWAIDDCSLFEPTQKEMVTTFGDNYNDMLGDNDFMIGNTRENIYFVLPSEDRNWHLQCHEAMVINNKEMFLTWLGIDKKLQEKIEFKIYTSGYRNSDTSIEFYSDDVLTDIEETQLLKGEEKFNKHIEEVLKRIDIDVQYRYSDESILENDVYNFEYLEDGTIF